MCDISLQIYWKYHRCVSSLWFLTYIIISVARLLANVILPNLCKSHAKDAVMSCDIGRCEHWHRSLRALASVDANTGIGRCRMTFALLSHDFRAAFTRHSRYIRTTFALLACNLSLTGRADILPAQDVICGQDCAWGSSFVFAFDGVEMVVIKSKKRARAFLICRNKCNFVNWKQLLQL